MKFGLLGRKLGMTRVYDKSGKVRVVTVIDATDNTVLQRKSVETDGYNAIQIGFDDQKEQRMSQPVLGQCKKFGSAPKKLIREFRLKEAIPADAELATGVHQFDEGDLVDVIGQSKGKGFQGVMKRHNFHGQGASHGSKTHRRNGAIGCRSTPGRIFKNQGMPGHMGDARITVQNLPVYQVRKDENIILVGGPVPGATGSYVMVRPAVKHRPKSAAKA